MQIKRLPTFVKSELVAPGSCFLPTPTDTMLVSYPKSGNTWVRALVSHVVRSNPTLEEMDCVVPDIYRSKGRDIRRANRFPCGGRLIKSHESFRPTYRRFVYIVRDPRDVCISYYYFLKDVKMRHEFRTIDFEVFVQKFVSGKIDVFGTWHEHVRSWQCAAEADRLFLKYEDFLSEPEANLREVCKFLQVEASEEVISAAVSACSIECLREKEERERGKWGAIKNARSSARFFRAGRAKSWSSREKNDVWKIGDKWAEEMNRWGYCE